MSTALYLLDANVVLRLVLRQPPDQARQVHALFAAAQRGDLRLELSAIIVAQCVYVLKRFYEIDRVSIANAMERVINLPEIDTPEAAVLLRALQHFGRSSLEFGDAYLAAVADARDVGVASFDRDFKKMRTVKTFDWS